MVRENDVNRVRYVWIMRYRRIQVEKHRQINLLMWVDELVLEAKTLNFVEVLSDLFRKNLIDGNPSYWFIRPVVHFIEGKGSFASIYGERSG